MVSRTTPLFGSMDVFIKTWWNHAFVYQVWVFRRCLTCKSLDSDQNCKKITSIPAWPCCQIFKFLKICCSRFTKYTWIGRNPRHRLSILLLVEGQGNVERDWRQWNQSERRGGKVIFSFGSFVSRAWGFPRCGGDLKGHGWCFSSWVWPEEKHCAQVW